ncbi:MAG: M2 family metallopeptidase [Kofleriaceae bacterium]|nr:M2 family metallopeptidase [Kofleriaceae bacterium]MBP6838813.1 M2 family metallopeptidase [Kofleriaceae bacterium]MBP9202878.1 M2 family metallopeptidase [Kofleriaceae bacterium]
MNVRRVLPLLLLTMAACAGGRTTKAPSAGSPTVEEAVAFVAAADRENREVSTRAALAEWAVSTDITPANEAAAAKVGDELMQMTTRQAKEATRFDGLHDRLDDSTRRQLVLMKLQGTPAPADPAKAAELAKVMIEMESAYGKGKACDAAGACRDLGQLEELMAASRDPQALLAAWQGWHEVGRGIGPMYTRFVELANDGVRGLGFADVGAMWRSRYDMPAEAVTAEVDRLWGQVAPLYQQLHCYARRRLGKTYGAAMPATGPMPAHLLGNMWAQDWSNLYRDLEPYPGQPSLDVTPALLAQGYDATRMTRLAEGFFTSLGMPALPATFWTSSMLTKPKDREVVCHPSAWDPHFNGDVRIKMCVKINQEDLITLHHELGHDYYYLAYKDAPILFQDGANDGFHEAIGDTIALSITPSYLKRVGLIDQVATSPEAEIDEQMFRALDKIAFLPFGLVIDKWRWEVFSGAVAPAQYNARWWQLREQYQGIAAPGPRPDGAFDPGAKYHVPGNTPYLRYFLSTVLQFQFHRALCKIAGHQGPLHTCSIYGNKDAGARFSAMLAMGSRRPWPDALEALTGERTIDASAILDYFAPLATWLAKENAGQTCGW